MIPIPIIATIIVALYILSAIKILREYERGVIFRLGSYCRAPKGRESSWCSRRWTAWYGFRCARKH